MPDIIRSSSVNSTVVATISAIADQSTLNAVSPTVSATIDSLPATITAWAWKVNGATTGITGPTTATPSYTPTTAGAKVITVDVTIDGVVYSSLPEIFVVGAGELSVSIAAVSDQLDLAAATLDSTVTNAIGSVTYAWTVNGATTGLSSSTAADPTMTPTAAGKYTAVVTATDAAGRTAKATVTWTVGKYVASLDRWVALRASVDFTAEATASWLAAGATPTTRSIGGYSFTSSGADKAAEFGIINTSGVRVYHGASATSRLTAPGLYIPIQSIIADWAIGDPLILQVQHDVADLADGAGFVALTLCSTVPTTDAAGTYFVFTGYERTATAVHKAFVDHNDGSTGTSSATTTLAGAAHGQEVIHDGNGARFGVFLTDPAGTPPDPGSSTLVPMVAASPSDTGPVVWIRRTPGSAAIDPAGCRIGILHHGNNTGLKRHVERLWVWG